jgi:hypothetical protein
MLLLIIQSIRKKGIKMKHEKTVDTKEGTKEGTEEQKRFET